MYFLLIPFAFVQLLFIFARRSSFHEVREAVIKSAVIIAAFITFSTEALSVFTALTGVNLILLWSVFNAGLFAHAFNSSRKENIAAILKEAFRSKIELAKSSENAALLFFIGLIYLLVSITALFSPPNTSDSMSYHLARVAHWIQQSSVEFYPTAILRQLYQSPLAEYEILHLQLLAGNDYYANFVQFFAFVFVGITASLLVKECGQNNRTQIIATLLTATIPMAILQASGTQNDLVVSFFVAAFLYFFLRAVQTGNWNHFVFAGLSLGSAFLSKGTAYIFCLPIGAFLFFGYFLKNPDRSAKFRLVRQTAAVVLLACAFGIGQYARNYSLFGAPLSTGDDKVLNQKHTLPIIFSNIVRNYGLHLASLSGSANNFINENIINLLGNEIKNPDSTYLRMGFKTVYSEHEDDAGNLIHIFLLTAALFTTAFYKGVQRKNIRLISGSIAAGFLIYCVLMMWQPWASRLHLPLFMMGCVPSAILLSKLHTRLMHLLILTLLIFSLPIIFLGEPRSVLFSVTTPRSEQYFAANTKISTAYFEGIEFLKQSGEEEIGVNFKLDYEKQQADDWEYPLWILSKDGANSKLHFRHVGVKNISNRLEKNDSMPELVFANNPETVFDGAEYESVWKKDQFQILRKKR
jgi:Dolichyl-phosphate-mannose-protein mannosyltransferase